MIRRLVVCVLPIFITSFAMGSEYGKSDFEDFLGSYEIIDSECNINGNLKSINVTYFATYRPTINETEQNDRNQLAIQIFDDKNLVHSYQLDEYLIEGEGRFSGARFTIDKDCLIHRWNSNYGEKGFSLCKGHDDIFSLKRTCAGHIGVLLRCASCSLKLAKD